MKGKVIFCISQYWPTSILVAWNENQGKWPNKMAGSLGLHKPISFPSVQACFLIYLARTLQEELDWQWFTPLVLKKLLDVLITGSFLVYGELNQVSPQPEAHLHGGGCTQSLSNVSGYILSRWFLPYHLRTIAMASWQIQKFHKSHAESDLPSLPGTRVSKTERAIMVFGVKLQCFLKMQKATKMYF